MPKIAGTVLVIWNSQKYIPYFSIDNARVIYTKKVKIRKKWTCAVYIRSMKKGKNLERLITATSQARF